MTVADWLQLAGPVVGGALQSDAAKRAAAGQTAASQQAIGEQARQYDLSRSDLAPYREAGTAAVGRIRDLLGIGGTGLTPEQVMELDPGYQFRIGEGQKALTNRLGTMGLRNSGAALKAGTRYGQDYATNAYDTIFNRLSGLAGTGQTATTPGAGLGANYAGNVGNLLTGAANARGAASIGSANAWGNAIGTVGNYYSQQQMLDKILAANRNTYAS